MDHVYMEEMVKHEATGKDLLMRIGLIAAYLVLNIVILTLINLLFPIVLAISSWGLYIFWRRISKEYEYIYTDGNLDVDCVFHRSTRKHMTSIDIREFSLIAPADEHQYQGMYEKKYDKFLDAGRGGIRENTYVGICTREGQTLKMYFEPSEEMLNAMKKYSPRNVVLKSDRR